MSTPDAPGQGSSETAPGSDSEPTGLLYVAFEYPADGFEELNDWYNGEHIPERMSVPGFVVGHRYVSVEGRPRWLATYELTSPAVLQTPAYRRFHGPDESAWTRRVLLPSRPDFRRGVYDLLWSESDQGRQSAQGGSAGLLTLQLCPPKAADLAASDEADLKALLGCAGVNRVRFYRDLDAPRDRLFLADLDSLWAVQDQQFRRTWNRLTARLTEQSVAYARTVQVLIL